MRLNLGVMASQWDSRRFRPVLVFWADRLPAWLAVAALVEFLCLRLFIRLGPVLPHAQITITVTETLIFVGSAALTFALMLALASLTMIAWQTQLDSVRYCVTAVVILTIGLAIAGDVPPPSLFIAFILFALTILGTVLWSLRQSGVYMVWLALFATAYLALAYPTIVNTIHATLPYTAEARGLSEMLVILAALAALFILRPRRDWAAVGVGVLGAVLLAGLWFSVRWLPPTLMIWSVALTGYLPPVVYIIALGLWLYIFTSLIRSEGTRRQALGLALLALGGLRWDLSYYVLLALTGFLLLSRVTDETAHV